MCSALSGGTSEQSEDLSPNQTLCAIYAEDACSLLRPKIRIDCLHAAYEMSKAVQVNKNLQISWSYT